MLVATLTQLVAAKPHAVVLNQLAAAKHQLAAAKHQLAIHAAARNDVACCRDCSTSTIAAATWAANQLVVANQLAAAAIAVPASARSMVAC